MTNTERFIYIQLLWIATLLTRWIIGWTAGLVWLALGIVIVVHDIHARRRLEAPQ